MEKEILARWISMLWSLKVNPADFLGHFDRLSAAYSEERRRYHNLAHLSQCFKELDAARSIAHNPLEIEVALWYHDAVYDTKAKDNEEKSAGLADEFCKLVMPDSVESVHELVLATKHTGTPKTIDEQLIVDIDLSIFGQPWEVFARYNAAIRAEYSWVEPEFFFKERAKVLISFLARPQIYATEFFRTKYEQTARSNLFEAICKSTASVYLIEEEVLPSILVDSTSENRFIPVGFAHCEADAEEFCDHGRPGQYRFTVIHKVGVGK